MGCVASKKGAAEAAQPPVEAQQEELVQQEADEAAELQIADAPAVEAGQGGAEEEAKIEVEVSTDRAEAEAEPCSPESEVDGDEEVIQRVDSAAQQQLEADTEGGQLLEEETKDDAASAEITGEADILAAVAKESAREQEARDSRPELLSVKDRAKMFSSTREAGAERPTASKYKSENLVGQRGSVHAMAKRFQTALQQSNEDAASSQRMIELEQVTRGRKSSQSMAKYWRTVEEIEEIVQCRKEF